MFLPRRLENRSVTQPSLKSPFPVPSPCHTETFFPKPSMDPRLEANENGVFQDLFFFVELPRGHDGKQRHETIKRLIKENGGVVSSYPRTRVQYIVILSGDSRQRRYSPPSPERDRLQALQTADWNVSDLVWRFGVRETHQGGLEKGKKKVVRSDWVENSCKSGSLLPHGAWEVRCCPRQFGPFPPMFSRSPLITPIVPAPPHASTSSPAPDAVLPGPSPAPNAPPAWARNFVRPSPPGYAVNPLPNEAAISTLDLHNCPVDNGTVSKSSSERSIPPPLALWNAKVHNNIKTPSVSSTRSTLPSRRRSTTPPEPGLTLSRFFRSSLGIPLSFHLLRPPSVTLMLKLLITQLGGGELVPLQSATIIVLYRSCASVAYDTSDLKRVKDSIGTCASRICVDSTWIEKCCDARELVDHSAYLIPINRGDTEAEDATTWEEAKVEEESPSCLPLNNDDDLDDLVSSPPSPESLGGGGV